MHLETYSAFTVSVRKIVFRFLPNLFDIPKLRCEHLPRCPSRTGRNPAHYAPRCWPGTVTWRHGESHSMMQRGNTNADSHRGRPVGGTAPHSRGCRLAARRGHLETAAAGGRQRAASPGRTMSGANPRASDRTPTRQRRPRRLSGLLSHLMPAVRASQRRQYQPSSPPSTDQAGNQVNRCR